MPDLAALAGGGRKRQLNRIEIRSWRAVAALAGFGLVGLSQTASAQDRIGEITAATPHLQAPVRGERLSGWLLRQPLVQQAYLPGLVWRVPTQQASQARLKHFLLAQLAVGSEFSATSPSRERLAGWLRGLPVTGRVPVAVPDARWLQAHPDRDPVLDPEQEVILPRRPLTVTVVNEDGRLCQAAHRAGNDAFSYLALCRPADARQIDRAWIVQPDGHVRSFGIASWNREAQDEPAPGAWIWAPARDGRWPEHLSARLAEFLATQGPAADLPAGASAASGLPVLKPGADWSSLEAESPARNPMISANDWGLVGLLQTPTARMREASDLRFQYSRVFPYSRGTVMLQPLDWLEAGFRYTDISNRPYGPTSLSGDQTYKDKNVDFKLLLAKESAALPAIALGMTDIGGTGLFSSEYLVANKRSGNADWSIGIAWGYLGARGDLRNPLAIFGSGFDTRPGMTTTGAINTKSFFRGPVALFGGMQYQTPWDNLLVKLEYDGNDYRHEPQGNNQQQGSPLNAGIVYRYSPAVDLTAGIERGNTVMFGLTFHGLLDQVAMPKLLDTSPPRVSVERPRGEPDWSGTATDIKAQTRWPVRDITQHGSDLQVVFDEVYGAYFSQRLDRVIAILHRDAPAAINRFAIVIVERGLPITERYVLRDEWVAKKTRYRAMAEHFESVAAAEPRPRLPGNRLWTAARSPGTLGLEPSFSQTLGGPDGFVLYQLGVAAPGELRLRDDTWLSGRLNLRMLDNYDNYKYTAPSLLPRVRTHLREYQTSARVTLPSLQVTHVGKLGANQFYSAYAGYLESMFAGAGAEWLYRPWHSRYAFGIDINRVQQRDFRQDFALRDYRVNTGHASLYLDTGWKSTFVALSAGQYLAGDRGITIDISRTFRNGISVGAFATKTNVSAAQFGEGSFDKGIYVAIPFDAMLPYSSPAIGTFKWTPLTRDGGARLGRANSLYGMTGARDRRSDGIRPAGRPPWLIEDDDRYDGPPERSIFGELAQSTASLGEQLVSGQTATALAWAGGAVLVASALDRPADRWAADHQQGRWKTAGTAASAIPYALGAATGLFWMGLGGDAAAETAWSSIKAVGLTLGAEVLTKYAVGRARPEENLGPARFAGFGNKAANSGFPSIHMGVAFAAVTPFAQQYDAPWLYGLAALTAFGRIQERQHFVSDTVAGSLIGYGIGSLMLDLQRKRRDAPRISLGADRSIRASWDFN